MVYGDPCKSAHHNGDLGTLGANCKLKVCSYNIKHRGVTRKVLKLREITQFGSITKPKCAKPQTGTFHFVYLG